MKILPSLCVICLTLLLTYACNTPSGDNRETVSDTEINTKESVPDMHTSEISLDWAGTYKGTLPCADCGGIETTIILHQNQTFERTAIYQGKEDGTFRNEGKFSWDTSGSIVTLHIGKEDPSYRVREGSIVLLNQDGEENKGELAELYILTKQ